MTVERNATRSSLAAFGAMRTRDIAAIRTAPIVHMALAGPRKKCRALGIAGIANDAATSRFPSACRSRGDRRARAGLAGFGKLSNASISISAIAHPDAG